MALPVRPPMQPMLAKLARTLPEGGWIYEPKWDGFRALVYRDGPEVDIRSRHDRKLARYFPEIVAAVRSLSTEQIVLDGELVVMGESGLDFAALMARLHPAATRVERLAKETPAVLIAFDLLALGARDMRRVPFAERRALLEKIVSHDDAGRHLLVTPATGDRALAERWVERFHGGGIDGVVAKEPASVYESGKRAMVKVKKDRTLDAVVAGFRLLTEGTVVGSLLLGLYDEKGRLVHVGVTSQFTDARRIELLRELRPYITSIHTHPWEKGFGLERSPLGRLGGSAGRWTPDEMDRDWIPLRPELVAEVTYDTLDGRRMRHPARFVRFRPDRDPRSCRFDQIEEAPPDVRALVAS